VGGARDDDAVQAGELVGGEVVIGDAARGPEVLAVIAGVDGAHRHHKAQPVGRGDLAASPGLRQANSGLGLDQFCIGGGDGLGAHEVVAYPLQPVS